MTENEKIIKKLYEDGTFPLSWADKVKEVLEKEEMGKEGGTFRGVWIPVEAKVPIGPAAEVTEDDAEDAILAGIVDEYIVTIKGAQVPTALYYLGNGLWWDETVNQTCEVVAWMQMPEAYKGDKRP